MIREALVGLWRRMVFLLMGRWVMQCLEPPHTGREILTEIRTKDHYMVVYCEVIIYKMSFRRWWITDKSFRVYKVSSVCDGDGHDKLRQVTSESVYLPELPSWSLDSKSHRTQLINVYIDVIISRLKKLSHI